jgi:hypothetical protein
MGTLFSGPKIPPPPPLPPPPRLPTDNSKEIKARARRAYAERTGRQSTILTEANKETTQTLGGMSGKEYPGLTKG